jgi:hypothetical protein
MPPGTIHLTRKNVHAYRIYSTTAFFQRPPQGCQCMPPGTIHATFKNVHAYRIYSTTALFQRPPQGCQCMPPGTIHATCKNVHAYRMLPSSGTALSSSLTVNRRCGETWRFHSKGRRISPMCYLLSCWSIARFSIL